MADVAVESLLEKLKKVPLYHDAHPIKDTKSQVENLAKDLQVFKAFLNDSTKNRNKDETVKELVSQIKDLAYDIEDVIDSQITRAADTRSKRYFKKFARAQANFTRINQDVVEIRNKVKAILDRGMIDFATRGIAHPHPPPETEIVEYHKALVVREDRVVGFEDEAKTIISYLREEMLELDVITIVGMSGLGKTTLAAKIFRDPEIKYEFHKCIWFNVSHECRKDDAFLTIIRDISKAREELERYKFLIVLDDVWSARTWMDLSEAIPKTTRGSKVLITSQNEEVALEANPDRDPHKLRFFTVDESWQLLQLEVFGKLICPPDLVMFGAYIVDKCGGLPLAITVIGRILLEKALSKDTIAMKNAWRKVSESLSTYLRLEDTSMDNSFSLSYSQLPNYLRPCFLYLGMFPVDYNIPVSKLIQLWIAEGFIQQRNGVTLEETAHNFLVELVRRNLVMVNKMSTYTQMKTCHLHYMLHLFCKNVAATDRENFFREIRSSTEGCFEPPVTKIENIRRLCVHSNVVDFISSQPYGPLVRSLLCFSKEDQGPLPVKEVPSIPKAFKLLKILDAEPINFTKFPRDFSKLVNLRYIVLSSNFKLIPEALSKLWNLQTLVIYTSSRTLEIKANIWKMMQLRHVKTNASALLPKMGRRKEGENLQTLGAISPQSCTEDLFDRVCNLRKLGIRGLLSELLDVKGLDKLEKLEKLKLVNDLWNDPTYGSSRRISRQLPYAYALPPNLRRITLCATYLEWSEMSKLEMLDNLEVLKVKENAFVGPFWEAKAGGFCCLEVLHIECTDLVMWGAEAYHFPKLRSLLLRDCQSLAEIPHNLSKVESLQYLDLAQVTDSVVASARKIKDAKKQQQKQGYLTASNRMKFQLCIDHENDNLSIPDSLKGKGKQIEE